MRLGTQIELPGIQGAEDLSYTITAPTGSRRVKVYLVPSDISSDRYFISITDSGGTEIVPPSRAKDTVLLADFGQDESGKTTVHYINEEVKNA